jgi:hypothetical protein
MMTHGGWGFHAYRFVGGDAWRCTGLNMKKRMHDLMTRLHICENALILIASWDCENYRTGIGSCYRARRMEDASETSKRCCAPCIAHKTLMSYK